MEQGAVPHRANVSDRLLWQAVQRGDSDAFAVVFDRYSNRIFSYCFQRTADPEIAKDLMSIVFLEAWRRRLDPTFTDDFVLAWLYGIATNVLRNQRRSQRRYRAALTRLPRFDFQPDFAEEVDARLTAAETMKKIATVLRDMHEGERECIALCTWQGLTSAEAAVALGIPPETVRSRLHRANQRLRNQLAAAEGDLDTAHERRAQP